jgi:aquaporin Z
VRPAPSGWHWTEWGCEFAGTALLLLGGLSGLFFDVSPGNPVQPAVPSLTTRLLFTGLILGGCGLAVTVSPLGRRSGAHLNPAVSLAFSLRGHMQRRDLAGYVAAQVCGAIAGTAVALALGGQSANAVDLGATKPGAGISPVGAAAIELAMTFTLLLGILLAVSFERSARWTPILAWGTVAVCVWRCGALTGASLNPARSIAPALLAPYTTNLWAYLVGPLAGSLLAVACYGGFKGLHTRTAKILHDPRYVSALATSLPAAGRT